MCCRGSQKYNHAWDLQQLREVWTKNFKSSAAAEDDVQEDDVEMTVEGRASSVGAPEDEDAFEKQMRLSRKTNPHLENSMILSRKGPWTRPWKAH